MTLDEYVAWAEGIGARRRAGRPPDRGVLEAALGLASEIGEVAGVLVRGLRDGTWRPDRLADELGDVAYHWARLCALTGVAPSMLLARHRVHVEWRRAGGPPGGPAPAPGAITLDEYAAWAAGADGPGPGEPPDDEWLWDTALALVGDAGEVADGLRRLRREGKPQRERLAGELGDVWRYWSRLASATGVTPAELLSRSRAKIEARIGAASLPPGAPARPGDRPGEPA
jgi:NTP pyrophosphatase (non-canonical NTP hydrolase)